MKIKCDFVTNSSSAGFIIGINKIEFDTFQEYLKELNRHPDAGNEGVRTYMIAKTPEELDIHTNDGEIDWAQKPTGPRFKNLSEEHYKLCKEVIDHGGIAMEVWVDYNVCEQFGDRYEDQILDCFS